VYNRQRSRFADDAVCILIDASALGGMSMNAGKVGLVVITLERTAGKACYLPLPRSHHPGTHQGKACYLPLPRRHHPRTLLQDRPRHRTPEALYLKPEALSRLDDVGGRGAAVD